MNARAQYFDKKSAELETFLDSTHARTVKSDGAVLDSAERKAISAEIIKETLPKSVQDVIGIMPEKHQDRVLDSIMMGAEIHKRTHGVLPTGDVLHAALSQAMTAAKRMNADGELVMDSTGSTEHHDQISAQPNRVVVAITSAMVEAIPFGVYLPVDVGSNEARLGIVTHLAGKTFGEYTQNSIMDGVNVGKTYVTAERRITLTLDAERDAATGKVTGVTGGSEDTKVLRGRTIILVNGFPCAYENPNTAATVADSPISGTATIGSTNYVISGTVTIATGAIAIAIAPAFPSGTVVEAEGFIDYEAAPTLIPSIMTQVVTHSLYASPWRVLAKQTIDSRTQYSNELGLDLQSENLVAVRNQSAMERHYLALRKLKAIATNNARTYDFDWSGQKAEKTRALIWQDAMAVIGIADQQMAEDTMDHGITHMYVSKKVAAQVQSLPRELFIPSRITVAPGIFWLGTLFGRYQVYYTPREVTDGSGTAQILCIGRSTQVARCPVVLGDAVAPTFLPLAMVDDLKYGNAFYSRNFTSVNPHVPSAMGAALINITNFGV